MYITELLSISQFSHSVVSDSLQPHGQQHSRLPCPSLSPRVCTISCPLSWWCHSKLPPIMWLKTTDIHSLPVLEARGGKSRCEWNCTLWSPQMRTVLPVPAGCQHPWGSSIRCPTPLCLHPHVRSFPLPLCVPSSFYKDPCHWLRALPAPAQPHPSLIAPAKTLFPNTLTSTGARI